MVENYFNLGRPVAYLRRSTPTLSKNKFERNSAFVNGGAIYNKKNSNLTISGDRTDGGGIYISTGPVVNLNSGEFSHNNAVNGGGIYQFDNSELTATYCSFSENTASTDGGGIYAYKAISTIENCSFEDNTATGNGGGVFILNPKQDLQSNISSFNLNSFKSNIAFQGSALFIDRTTNYSNNTFVLNNLFAENHATDKGVVYMQGNNNNTIFNHNTVTNNTAAYLISGVCYEDDGFFSNEFKNNIIYEAMSDVYITSTYQLPTYYLTLAGINYLNNDNNYNPNPIPGFVSITDYHLSSSSPCIDPTGSDNSATQTSTDLDGNTRIINIKTDFGCYEYGSTSPARKSKPNPSLSDKDISIYPNPATDYIVINTSSEQYIDISIYALSGQRVYISENSLINGEKIISLSGFKPGAYIIKLQTQDSSISERIIIQ